MLVEIPDPSIILSVIFAFVVGIVGLFVYQRVRPYIKLNEKVDVSQLERLEYYERQLIDMKIRLDALEIQGIEEKHEDPNMELKDFIAKLVEKQEKIDDDAAPLVQKVEPNLENNDLISNFSKIDYNNPTDYVLHLITDKAMTSRDIQITLKKSREHTSRLLKKLFDDGLVQRNENSKPYSYSITDKGIAKINHQPLVQ
ncbi:MAG: winged helix DNA-binding protein [Nitrosopumilus sp.]